MSKPDYTEFSHFGNQVFSQPESDIDELANCKITGEPKQLKETLENLQSTKNSNVLIYMVANGGEGVLQFPDSTWLFADEFHSYI